MGGQSPGHRLDGHARRRGRRPKSLTPPGGGHSPDGPADQDRTLEGAAATDALAEAGRRSTSRRELERHESFREISPQVGVLDEQAFDDALRDDPDEALTLLAELVGATDEELRRLARALAGRIVVDLVRTGAPRRRGIGRLHHRPADLGGELDIERSLDPIASARARGESPALDELRARDWSRPDVALCVLLDRSGSMEGKRLATAAVAAAAAYWRAPADTSVVAFDDEAVVLAAQGSARDPEDVVGDVLRLRGHGTTDLAFAFRTAAAQLSRSNAARRVTVLLSDGRETAGGDPTVAATALDELLIVAPADDADQARALAAATGARLVTVSGPAEVPDALLQALSD